MKKTKDVQNVEKNNGNDEGNVKAFAKSKSK